MIYEGGGGGGDIYEEGGRWMYKGGVIYMWRGIS